MDWPIQSLNLFVSTLRSSQASSPPFGRFPFHWKANISPGQERRNPRQYLGLFPLRPGRSPAMPPKRVTNSCRFRETTPPPPTNMGPDVRVLVWTVFLFKRNPNCRMWPKRGRVLRKVQKEPANLANLSSPKCLVAMFLFHLCSPKGPTKTINLAD